MKRTEWSVSKEHEVVKRGNIFDKYFAGIQYCFVIDKVEQLIYVWAVDDLIVIIWGIKKKILVLTTYFESKTKF